MSHRPRAIGLEPIRPILDRVIERWHPLQALIGAVPDGHMMRCHTPPFGLRFGDGERALSVSLCFRCHNACVGGDLMAFAAETPQGKKLLAFLKARVPAGWRSLE